MNTFVILDSVWTRSSVVWIEIHPVFLHQLWLFSYYAADLVWFFFYSTCIKTHCSYAFFILQAKSIRTGAFSYMFTCSIHLPLHIHKIAAEYTSIKTGPAAFLWNYLSCAKTKSGEESKSPGLVLPFTSFYHFSFIVCSTVCHHLCPLLRQLQHDFLPLTCTYPDTHSYRETLAGPGSPAWSKAVCEGVRIPRRKQLPLAVSASHPGLTAARNMRPPQTSVLGKKTGQDRHIHWETLLSLLPLSLSLARSNIQRRKKAVCLCSFTHSATNRNLRFTYALPLPPSQNH